MYFSVLECRAVMLCIPSLCCQGNKFSCEGAWTREQEGNNNCTIFGLSILRS